MRPGTCSSEIMRTCGAKLREDSWLVLINGSKNRLKIVLPSRVMGVAASKARPRWTSRMRLECTMGTFFRTRRRFLLPSAESRSGHGVSRLNTKMCFSAGRARSAAAQSAVFPDTTPRAPCSRVFDMKSEAMASDVESIDAIIIATYDVISGQAGKTRDWDRLRSPFSPGRRLIPAAKEEGRDDVDLAPNLLDVNGSVARAEPVVEKDGFYDTEIARRG